MTEPKGKPGRKPKYTIAVGDTWRTRAPGNRSGSSDRIIIIRHIIGDTIVGETIWGEAKQPVVAQNRRSLTVNFQPFPLTLVGPEAITIANSMGIPIFETTEWGPTVNTPYFPAIKQWAREHKPATPAKPDPEAEPTDTDVFKAIVNGFENLGQRLSTLEAAVIRLVDVQTATRRDIAELPERVTDHVAASGNTFIGDRQAVALALREALDNFTSP